MPTRLTWQSAASSNYDKMAVLVTHTHTGNLASEKGDLLKEPRTFLKCNTETVPSSTTWLHPPLLRNHCPQ